MMGQSTKETTGKVNKIIALIKGVFAFLLVTLSLFHVFFNAKSDLVPLNNKKYSAEIERRNNLQNEYLEGLKNNQLSVDEYYKLTTTLITNSKKNVASINNEKRQINRDHSFRGRSSLHFWIFVFGLVTALFFFSCKSLHDDFSRGSTFKFHFVSLTGIMISVFWFIHLTFYTQKDFTQNNYVAFILFCSIVFSIPIYFLVRYYTYKDDIINEQLSFIMRVRKIHYPKIAIKAKLAEKNNSIKNLHDSTVNDDIDEFQDDLRNVVNNI